MEEKKQIQEMAREIAKRDCHLFDNCPKLSKHACISQNPTIMIESSKNYITIATWLVKLGYRKLPKDAVVLSKEEYERLKRVENEKDRLYEIKLDLENQLIEKGWTDYEGADEIEKRVSKETAEKILRDLYSEATSNVSETVELTTFQIEQLAKQFGVEVEDSGK